MVDRGPQDDEALSLKLTQPGRRRLKNTLTAYLIASAFAGLLFALHVPLAWLLGSLGATMLVSLAGLGPAPPTSLRKVGQLCIGSSVGLAMTSTAVETALRFLPLLVASALLAVFLSAVLSTLLARAARLDDKTAFFASLPGGLAEMGTVGGSLGARSEPIALAQALRVALTVLVVPPLLLTLGIADPAPAAATPEVTWLWIPAFLIGGSCVATLLTKLRINNPWMLGALLFAAVCASTDLVNGHLSSVVINLGQMLLGVAVGSQFRRDIVEKMPRVALFASLSVVAMSALLALVSLATAHLMGVPPATIILATAAGGMSEMSATAQLLHLSVPLVVAFQVVRAILVNGLASYYYRGFKRIGLLAAMDRLLGPRKQD